MCLTWKTSTQGGKNCQGVGEGEERVSMESKRLKRRVRRLGYSLKTSLVDDKVGAYIME